jgi:hypothetical protein
VRDSRVGVLLCNLPDDDFTGEALVKRLLLSLLALDRLYLQLSVLSLALGDGDALLVRRELPHGGLPAGLLFAGQSLLGLSSQRQGLLQPDLSSLLGLAELGRRGGSRRCCR